VHGCLVEQGQYGGANVAAPGAVAAMAAVTPFEGSAEAALMTAPAAFEPAPAVTVRVALRSAVLMDPGMTRIVDVVLHICLLTIRTL
jgi:hypothetical protein